VREASLRRGFLVFSDENIPDVTDVCNTLRDLNGYYHTRYSIGQIEPFARILIDGMKQSELVLSKPLDLMKDSTIDTETLAKFVKDVLASASSPTQSLKRPYSLLTKWLHFRYPQKYVIYDSQAASSVQEWSYFTYPLSEDDSAKKYQLVQTAVTSATGYKALLDFYRRCWSESDEQQQLQLQEVANNLSNEIKAHVSTIDVIDKTLWLAAGDPRKLGLI
jgi:hypothetical protein